MIRSSDYPILHLWSELYPHEYPIYLDPICLGEIPNKESHQPSHVPSFSEWISPALSPHVLWLGCQEELLRDATHHDVPVRRRAVKDLGKYREDPEAIEAIAKARTGGGWGWLGGMGMGDGDGWVWLGGMGMGVVGGWGMGMGYVDEVFKPWNWMGPLDAIGGCSFHEIWIMCDVLGVRLWETKMWRCLSVLISRMGGLPPGSFGDKLDLWKSNIKLKNESSLSQKMVMIMGDQVDY